ncbi:MAG: iron-containing alcohol dehydrogenase, partial [Flavobacteriales bacterium]|nr:iron-containing alcohol dehydrogenase [Flavobacteriales bacterium]
PSSRVAVLHGSSLNEDYKTKVFKAISAFEISFIEKTWEGEPTLASLSETIAEIEKIKPDMIIAIGGGSVIDGAKMVRTYYEFPFFNVNDTKISTLNWKTNFVAIPTTIGSGAEISSASAMYNDSKKSKEFVISHQFIPEIIVLEASLIANAPKKMLLSSMVDALSHCIEGYMSNINNMLIDSYAEKAIQIISKYYEVVSKGLDKENLNKLQLASVFAGMVQNHCIVGATHALAHQMSAFGLSHSNAISIFLPLVIRKNIENRESNNRFEQLAIHSGFSKGSKLLEFVEDIISSFDLQKEKNIVLNNREIILADESFFERALADKGGQGNPISMDKEFLQDIIKKLI